VKRIEKMEEDFMEDTDDHRIILATASRSRLAAFKLLGLDHVSCESKVDEYFAGRPSCPEELVQHLAKLKASAVAKRYSKGIVIGFDSVGFYKGTILEKPKSREEAFERLKSMAGNQHQFFTGIYMIDLESGKKICRCVETSVFMRSFRDSEIEKYLDQDEGFAACACGYNPLEFYSSTFVERIEGSYNNMTRGIPLETVMQMLDEIGYGG